MSNRKVIRGRSGPLRAVLGVVVGMSVTCSLGMLSDRSAKAGKSMERTGPAVVVPAASNGVQAQELDGPDDAGAPAREASAGQPADPGEPSPETSPETKVPRFLGTFSLSGEQRAIFEVQGATKPWMGKAGERIEGTEFLLEAFDASGARIVPVGHH